jgi:hypothetical protein
MHKKWMVFTITVGLLGSAFGVCAQESKQRKAEVEVFVQQNGPIDVGPRIEPRGDGDNFVFVATEMSFGGRVVKGAPYSAEAVTESVQTLADGNRIVHKTTAQVYRDSEGRTRRDQAAAAIGPFAAAGDTPQSIFISDPAAHVNYVLDPRSKIAHKLQVFEFKVSTDEKGAATTVTLPPPARASREAKEGVARTFVFQTDTPEPAVADVVSGPGAESHWSKAETKTEKLGTRNVEGVQAEGTRITTTIPAGAIGNEQPIEIVNENWYSPELQVVVMTSHSDPRFGQTSYKLTNVQRAEPAATLFQVPSDYTIKEGPGAGVRTNMRRERRPVEAPPPPEN